MKAALLLVACSLAMACSDGVDEATSGDGRAADFGISICTAPGNCQSEATAMVIDYRWTGCTNPSNCNSIPTTAEYSRNWGVSFSSGNSVRMNYAESYGARTYLTAGPTSNEYRMFYLLNRELTYDVDVSTTGCGMNSALYFVAMERDGGVASSGHKGAAYGTGYCDAQPPEPGRPSCDEMDIWEANSLAAVYTTHACQNGQCDPYGCGFNAYARGNKAYYGRGNTFQIDTSQPFTVVTRFVTVDGTDNGDLKEVQRFYKQNGRTIQQPVFDGFSSISDAYCSHFGLTNTQGGVSTGMSAGLRKGMVLAFALWGNPTDSTSMTWLDNEPNGPCPVYQNPNPYTSFTNIRFGPIGSTV